MAKWTIPDVLTRAEANAMVAAALMQAADLVDALSDDILDGAQACAETHPAFSEDRQEHAEDARQVAVRIRALITEDAQTALTQMLAGAPPSQN